MVRENNTLLCRGSHPALTLSLPWMEQRQEPAQLPAENQGTVPRNMRSLSQRRCRNGALCLWAQRVYATPASHSLVYELLSKRKWEEKATGYAQQESGSLSRETLGCRKQHHQRAQTSTSSSQQGHSPARVIPKEPIPSRGACPCLQTLPWSKSKPIPHRAGIVLGQESCQAPGSCCGADQSSRMGHLVQPQQHSGSPAQRGDERHHYQRELLTWATSCPGNPRGAFAHQRIPGLGCGES